MAGPSEIEWTDATWNPVAGCSVLSPGCSNCYAMRMAARLESMGCSKYAGTTRKSGHRYVWTGKINIDRSSLEIPLKWKKPRMVFVNSMSDLFHQDVPDSYIDQVWRVMKQADRHTFQVLTKRPERLASYLKNKGRVPSNIWLGTSVESEEYLSRIDVLRPVSAATKFISFEPLLGEIKQANLSGISWVIVGGESGPGSRPLKEHWVLELLSASRRYDAAFFFKQWGGVNKAKTGRRLKGNLYSEYPNPHSQKDAA